MTLLVVVIRDSVVYEVNEYPTPEAQEIAFFDKCVEYGEEPPTNEDYDNCYMRVDCDTSICLSYTHYAG